MRLGGRSSSHGELHDGAHDVSLGLPQRLDGLALGDAGLLHHEVDVVLLQARRVDLPPLALLLGRRLRRLVLVDELHKVVPPESRLMMVCQSRLQF